MDRVHSGRLTVYRIVNWSRSLNQWWRAQILWKWRGTLLITATSLYLDGQDFNTLKRYPRSNLDHSWHDGRWRTILVRRAAVRQHWAATPPCRPAQTRRSSAPSSLGCCYWGSLAQNSTETKGILTLGTTQWGTASQCRAVVANSSRVSMATHDLTRAPLAPSLENGWLLFRGTQPQNFGNKKWHQNTPGMTIDVIFSSNW
jgi:hypothetical protein